MQLTRSDSGNSCSSGTYSIPRSGQSGFPVTAAHQTVEAEVELAGAVRRPYDPAVYRERRRPGEKVDVAVAGRPLGDHPGSAVRHRSQDLLVQGVVDPAEHGLVARRGRGGVPVREHPQAARLMTAGEGSVERPAQQSLLVGEDAVRDDLHAGTSRGEVDRHRPWGPWVRVGPTARRSRGQPSGRRAATYSVRSSRRLV